MVTLRETDAELPINSSEVKLAYLAREPPCEAQDLLLLAVDDRSGPFPNFVHTCKHGPFWGLHFIVVASRDMYGFPGRNVLPYGLRNTAQPLLVVRKLSPDACLE